MRMKSEARVRKQRTCRKGDGAASRQAHRRADHHLFGDEILIEAIGEDFLEAIAERRVADVGVEGHHA